MSHPICEDCTYNNFGSCDFDRREYMNVYDEEDCDDYLEDEDCGLTDDQMADIERSNGDRWD